MKLSSTLLFACLAFSSSALACRYRAQSIDEQFESAQYVFTAVVTGVTLTDYEASSKTQIEADPEKFEERITIPEEVEFRLLPAQIFKGKDIPTQVMGGFCGAGQAELRDRVLVFVSEHEGKMYGYFISYKPKETHFEEGVARVKKLAH